MPMDLNRHLEDEEIEQYSLRSLPETEVERVEEHLLICETCRKRIEASDQYLQAVRDAGRDLRERPVRRKFRLYILALPLAAAVIAVIAAALFPRSTSREHLPFAVSLSAVRGVAGESKAPSGQNLDLRLDLTGLAEGSAYRINVVDQSGKVVSMALLPETRIGALPAGTYFVRVYSRGDELLREYGLQVEAGK